MRKEMDILQPYIEDKSISEIMVNGKDHVFAERNGKLERLPIAFDSTEDLEELIRRVAARVHREINELNPIVDARLSDGSRVNAVYKNIALNGPILTIRKFPEKIMSMEDLVEKETITKEAAAYLKVLVETGYNCFICGGIILRKDDDAQCAGTVCPFGGASGRDRGFCGTADQTGRKYCKTGMQKCKCTRKGGSGYGSAGKSQFEDATGQDFNWRSSRKGGDGYDPGTQYWT